MRKYVLIVSTQLTINFSSQSPFECYSLVLLNVTTCWRAPSEAEISFMCEMTLIPERESRSRFLAIYMIF